MSLPQNHNSLRLIRCFAMPRGVTKQADTVDWNAFVHESDPEVNSGYTEATRTQIGHVKSSFQKYVTLAC